MDLLDKSRKLLASPTLTIRTFEDAWDRNMGDNTIFEEELVITHLVCNSEHFNNPDTIYIETECGELFEWVWWPNGCRLTCIDTEKWKPDCYYADDDELEENPLYYTSYMHEMIDISGAMIKVVIKNEPYLWQFVSDSPLSNALLDQYPNKLQIHIK